MGRALSPSPRPESYYAPALQPIRLYAREGEYVMCERGHFVGYITRDLAYGEAICGDEVSNVFIKPKQPWPKCRCGARFAREGQFRFRKGYRT